MPDRTASALAERGSGGALQPLQRQRRVWKEPNTSTRSPRPAWASTCASACSTVSARWAWPPYRPGGSATGQHSARGPSSPARVHSPTTSCSACTTPTASLSCSAAYTARVRPADASAFSARASWPRRLRVVPDIDTDLHPSRSNACRRPEMRAAATPAAHAARGTGLSSARSAAMAAPALGQLDRAGQRRGRQFHAQADIAPAPALGIDWFVEIIAAAADRVGADQARASTLDGGSVSPRITGFQPRMMPASRCRSLRGPRPAIRHGRCPRW